MADKIIIKREQLSQVFEDHDTVTQFEKLIDLVNSLNIDGTETLEEIIERVHGTLP